jgi:hypothetical protein
VSHCDTIIRPDAKGVDINRKAAVSVVCPYAEIQTEYLLRSCSVTCLVFLNVIQLSHLKDYRFIVGEEFCAPQLPGELCWRESELLVELLMPDISKCRGQKKCSFWSFRFGFLREAATSRRKNVLLRVQSHGEGQDPHRAAAPVKRRVYGGATLPLPHMSSWYSA